MSKLRTFIVEDSPVIRENLIATLEELVPLEVVGYAEDEPGALRWLRSEARAVDVHNAVRAAGGHAALFRPTEAAHADADSPFAPLDAGTAALHRRVKLAFDPKRIFNPGRLYAEL